MTFHMITPKSLRMPGSKGRGGKLSFYVQHINLRLFRNLNYL